MLWLFQVYEEGKSNKAIGNVAVSPVYTYYCTTIKLYATYIQHIIKEVFSMLYIIALSGRYWLLPSIQLV